MSLVTSPSDPYLEPLHAFSATREMLDESIEGAPLFSPSDTEPGESPDPGDEYALQFLTYAYTVPFRLIAVQQELSDVFGFEGTFDSDFLARWEALSHPEQAAFSQSYREYRRMQALANTFTAADHSDVAEASVQERAGRFVAAHLDGLEQWQSILRHEAATTARQTELQTENVTIPATATPENEVTSAISEGGSKRQFLVEMDRLAGSDLAAITRHLASVDNLAHAVLEKLADNEMVEARRRFLVRVRWMLSLPNQQRMAIALRTTGRKRREISAAMGISEESVKTHLSRADEDWNQQQASVEPQRTKENRGTNRTPDADSKSGR